MTKKQPTTEEVDAALARWRTKLKRAFGTIDKLERQRKRIDRKPPPVTMIGIAAPELAEATAAKPDGLDIPDFLKRQQDAVRRDQVALEEIAADKERRAKAKRDSKGVVKPSKKLGVDAQKMPLSGKAALAHIRNG